MNCSKTCSQAYVCLTPIVILATALYHIPGRGNNMQSREVKRGMGSSRELQSQGRYLNNRLPMNECFMILYSFRIVFS